jgi:hypothetical protein
MEARKQRGSLDDVGRSGLRNGVVDGQVISSKRVKKEIVDGWIFWSKIRALVVARA